MHPYLVRQLESAFGPGAAPVEGPLRLLLEAVSRTYQIADDERAASMLLDAAVHDRAQSERDAFFRTSPDLLCIIDERHRFTQLSPSWEVILGYQPEALEGTEAQALAHPEDQGRAGEFMGTILAGGSVSGLELRLRAQDGAWRWFSWTGTLDPLRRLLFCIGRDVTRQRELALELSQAQKLEAIGQLAAGVAHEINTPVQFVGDNLGFLADSFAQVLEYLAVVQVQLGKCPLDPSTRAVLGAAAERADLDYLKQELPKALSESRDGVKRVAELVRALKESAYPDPVELEPGDLNRVVERAVLLARGELKHVAQVSLELEPLPPVTCHPGGLTQVFINLLVNAAHAIEDRAAGPVPAGWEPRITIQSRPRGEEVEVRVADTGCGIPLALRERIFEPFFTTKPMGKGSGQGLPLVRSVVVTQHHGRIELESEVGQGTTFVLRLPLRPPGLTAELEREQAA